MCSCGKNFSLPELHAGVNWHYDLQRIDGASGHSLPEGQETGGVLRGRNPNCDE